MSIPPTDEYEEWFANGARPVWDYVCNKQFEAAQLREIVLTDMFLRDQAGVDFDPSEYASRLPTIAADHAFQIELWLEAFGYAEQRGQTRSQFLAQVPGELREAVQSAIQSDAIPPVSQQDSAPDIPPELERYEVRAEIGRGVFGVVYEAWDTQLARSVAIKVLLREGIDSEFAEARLVAKLDHPGIVSVFDCGIDNLGRGFIVTALLSGESLEHWLHQTTRPSVEEICELFEALCESLYAAHQQGVVHRDLKPSNIIVQEGGRPTVLDFGLALSEWQGGQRGELIGTPAYMSPEQARGEGHLVDARSDVFSVGVLFFEAIAGTRPWKSESSRELLREIAQGSVRSVRQFDTTIPLALERICSKATATAMSDRFGTMRDFAGELRWFLDSTRSESQLLLQEHPIAPKGLRAYTSENAAGFWQLLPGQRGAQGIPDVVRWWLDRLQPNEDNSSPSVLVLYGPSGSGKSSLVHAGVVPFLDRSLVRTVVLDAAEAASADDIQRHLATKTKIDLDIDRTSDRETPLSRMLAELRERSAKRLVVVIDQFEQALAWPSRADREALVLALRQADGERLQFVLTVRDEFWSETSRLMRKLETPLRDGRNAMGVERLTEPHAASVLQLWAQASNLGPLSEEFVQQAIRLVSENQRVVPVRLALLAAMLGQQPWTIERLRQFANRGSLTAYYLDTELGHDARIARRSLADAAKRFIRRLVPESGNLRGPACTAQSLMVHTGVTREEFDDLVDLLDRQLQLITPVDTGLQEVDENGQASVAYNLPHDFLVKEVRGWLDSDERSSIRGRAQSDLRAAAHRWASDPRPQNLAGPMTAGRFALLARAEDDQQRAFLGKSAARQLLVASAVACIACVLFGGFFVLLRRTQATALVTRLEESSVDGLRQIIRETRSARYWTSDLLRGKLAANGVTSADTSRDRIALVMLDQDPSQANYLCDRILVCEPPMMRCILEQLADDLDVDDRSAALAQLAAQVTDDTRSSEQRLRAAIGIGALDPDHAIWKEQGEPICQMLVESNPTQLGWLADGLLPVRSQLSLGLSSLYQSALPEQQRTLAYLLAKFSVGDNPALVKLLANAKLLQLPAIAPAIRSADAEMDLLLKTAFLESVDRWQASAPDRPANHKVDEDLQKQNEPAGEFPPPNRVIAAEARQVSLARETGNLGALLLQRSSSEDVLPWLRLSSDLTLRSYLIEAYASSEGPAGPVVELLHIDKPNSISPDEASALLQILGSLPASSRVPATVRAYAGRVIQRSDHLELAATARWYLRIHGYDDDVKSTHLNPDLGFLSTEGQWMVRVPSGTTASVGSSTLDLNRLANEKQHSLEIPSGLHVSQYEVTVEQLNRFRRETGIPPMSANDRTGDEAAMRIGFYEAVAYCNWLSSREGIPDSQLCYTPSRDGLFAAGMRVAEDHLSREGYQLPTPDLWEYICRAGTSTPRPYGYGMELSRVYMRSGDSRRESDRRVGLRKPNAFGVFDMLGNASEWSLGLVADSQSNRFGPRPGPRDQRGPRDSKQLVAPDQHSRPDPQFPPGPGIPFSEGGRSHDDALNQQGPREQGRPGMAFGGGPQLESAAGKTIRDNSRFVLLGGAYDSPAHKTRSSDRSIISPPITNQPVGFRLIRIIK